jgi:hypothetical protein
MNLEVTADKGELTVRDAWEGQHEVHAGGCIVFQVWVLAASQQTLCFKQINSLVVLMGSRQQRSSA